MTLEHSWVPQATLFTELHPLGSQAQHILAPFGLLLRVLETPGFLELAGQGKWMRAKSDLQRNQVKPQFSQAGHVSFE